MNPTPTTRRSLLALSALTAATLTLASAPLAALAQAAAYPDQPVRLVVPFPPAGGTDILSRLLANRIATDNGWTIVIDNKAGAGGNIGLDAVAKAKADGYTLGTAQTANLAINPALYSKLPFDPVKDFTPVALIASQPMVLVVPASSPYKTVAELVAAAKAKPARLTMGSAGNGTVGHLAGEMFAQGFGVKFLHVPYKGAAPVLTDLLGGQIDLSFSTPQAVVQQIKGGKLRALAVTSAKRSKILPDVPTVAESGQPGFEAVDWKALVAPAGTPDAIVQRLNAAVNKALQAPDTLAKLAAEGSDPVGGSTKKFADFLKLEQAHWGKLVRDVGAKLD